MHTMTDHPGWQRADGCWRRLFVADEGRSWLVELPNHHTGRHHKVSTFTLPLALPWRPRS
jgi:hypothetical protein